MSEDQINHNPFSTRNTFPGAIPYLFERNKPNDVYGLFAKNNCIAQITGPHGSGKSTLLVTLLKTLQQNGHNTVFVSLHDRQRLLPWGFWKDFRRTFSSKKTGTKPTILVIDGYEQLCRPIRFFLQFVRKMTCCGLLITTHHAFCGIPVLHQTGTSLETLKMIVDDLLYHFDTTPNTVFSEEFLESLFLEKQGNIREVLFALYDRYEEICP